MSFRINNKKMKKQVEFLKDGKPIEGEKGYYDFTNKKDMKEYKETLLVGTIMKNKRN